MKLAKQVDLFAWNRFKLKKPQSTPCMN